MVTRIKFHHFVNDNVEKLKEGLMDERRTKKEEEGHFMDISIII
jgi:hypothetical protein